MTRFPEIFSVKFPLSRLIIRLCPLSYFDSMFVGDYPMMSGNFVLTHLTERIVFQLHPSFAWLLTSFTVSYNFLSYRLYPSYEYTKKEFAHKGPLSRLVTTTHPSNPFNKVDKWNSRPKKLCKRAKQSKFV